MTQISQIIGILRRNKKIDNWYCIDHRLTTRLAMHVNLLRKTGWDIRTEELKNKNCVYHLIAEPPRPVKATFDLTMSNQEMTKRMDLFWETGNSV